MRSGLPQALPVVCDGVCLDKTRVRDPRVMVTAVVLPADKVFVFITTLAVIGNRVNLVDVSAVKV
jgi:hypothetical protein